MCRSSIRAVLMALVASAVGLGCLLPANTGLNDANNAPDAAGNALGNQKQKVSDCRGFQGDLPFGSIPYDADAGAPAGYCDKEVLTYDHDAATGTLVLYHRRVSLNCCGERSIALHVEDGIFKVVETDSPQAGTGRCRCMCVFDFALQAEDVPSATLPVAVELNVTDAPTDSRQVWSGALDLTKDSGEIVVSTDPAFGCE